MLRTSDRQVLAVQGIQKYTIIHSTDDKLGGGDQFSTAEKYERRIVNVTGLEERELCAFVYVLGSA
jgi:hypothetical protein